jgi:hypothetical protein
MKLFLALVLVSLTCAACAGDSATPAADAKPAPVPCPAVGGFLTAQLRGGLTHDISWKGAELQCEGGPRPEGKGLRLTFAGPLPSAPGPDGKSADAPPRQLRFIFGVDLNDAAAGAVRVLPTNITVILEGAQQIFATRGDDRCAIESLERMPVAGNAKLEQVHARGYCISPAIDLASEATLLVPTFEFTGVVATGEDP